MMYLPCSPILVAYVPRRSVAKNRETTTVTIGAYCMYIDNMCQIRYTVALDIDRHVSETRLEQICDVIRKHLKTDIAMICRTAKGYHIYVTDYWYNPIQLYHKLMKLVKHVPELDKYQIKLGFIRSEAFCGWMIVRLGGKYLKHDIEVIYYEPSKCKDICHRIWIKKIYLLIELFKMYDPWDIVEIFNIPIAYFR